MSITTAVDTPPLRDGDMLDQPEFHRRYCAMPEDFRAELIDGRVYVVSPLYTNHGDFHGLVMSWLGAYRLKTRGVRLRDNTTTILGPRSEPQPDAALIIRPDYGGRTRVGADGCATGGPELIVEISDSTEARDLRQKYRDYEAAGVREYVVVLIRSRKIRWFRLENAKFIEIAADRGIYRSTSFPGLWLNAEALFNEEENALEATLLEGIASPEYAEFVARLTAQKLSEE